MRTSRCHIPGVLYHCILRLEREWFLDLPEERDRLLVLLGRALGRSDWSCLAYGILRNHVQLAMIAGERRMESWLGRLEAGFTRWMEIRHGGVTRVFANEAKDFQFYRANEANVVAHIHNAPVRGGLVRRAADSAWTSHRAFIGIDPAPQWLRTDESLARIGFPDRDVFDGWTDRTPGAAFDVTLELQRIAMRRRRADGFSASEGPVPPDPTRVIEIVADLIAVGIPVICSRRSSPAACDARAVVAHCGRAFGLAPTEVASALGVSTEAVAALLRREVGEHTRIVLDLAVEKLGLETWGTRGRLSASELRGRASQIVTASDGVPQRMSGGGWSSAGSAC
ncbi:hypothetical protein BH11MYX3_BH11MYX3_43970 [soil metagenome]